MWLLYEVSFIFSSGNIDLLILFVLYSKTICLPIAPLSIYKSEMLMQLKEYDIFTWQIAKKEFLKAAIKSYH